MQRIPLSGVIGIISMLAACGHEATNPIESTTGALQLVVRTTGFSPDPDGYTVRVAPDRNLRLASEDSVVLNELAPGTHKIELRDISANCSAAPSTSPAIVIAAGATAELRVEIACRGILHDVVLFTSLDGSGSAAGVRVMTMRPDGSEVNVLTVGAGGARLSPNREELVYVSLFQLGIRRVRVDGVGGIAVLGNTRQQSPDWSPDGSHIAFTSAESGEWQVYTMDRNGGDVRRLTTSNRQETGPRWSPDGTRILFGRSTPVFGTDIVVVKADGSSETTIAVGTAGPYGWSPDGTQILYNDISQGGNRIAIMGADGALPYIVTHGPSNDDSAIWSPDGNEIMLSRGGVGVFRTDVLGASPVLILPLTGSRQILDDWR